MECFIYFIYERFNSFCFLVDTIKMPSIKCRQLPDLFLMIQQMYLSSNADMNMIGYVRSIYCSHCTAFDLKVNLQLKMKLLKVRRMVLLLSWLRFSFYSYCVFRSPCIIFFLYFRCDIKVVILPFYFKLLCVLACLLVYIYIYIFEKK